MTTGEFSNGFDTLLNSHGSMAQFGKQASGQEIALDEYEKSLFLSKAQEELVLSLYNGRNSSLQGFEETEELRRYLSELVREAELLPIKTTDGKPLGIDSKSKFFALPEKLWFITYEAVAVEGGRCGEGFSQQVVPVTQDEYHRVKKNPFRGAGDRRALRLDLSDGVIEIVAKYPVSSYYLRYIKKLNPIILENLPNGLTIGGLSRENPAEVHESLHQRILEMAVQMAMQSKGVGMTSQRTKEEK